MKFQYALASIAAVCLIAVEPAAAAEPWANLQDPETISMGVATLIVGILGMFLLAGIWLRSAMTLLVWVFAVFMLGVAILTSETLTMFWVLVLFGSAVVALSAAVEVVFGVDV